MIRKLIRTLALSTLVFCMQQAPLSAQTINDNFLSQKTRYDFNLPTVGVALTLSPGMGFKVPILGEMEAFLDMQDRQVSYFFNDELASDGNAVFHFSLPDSSSTAMIFQVVKTDGFDMDGTLERIKNSELFEEMLNPISTKVGELIGYKSRMNDKVVYSYLTYQDGFVFIFYIFVNKPTDVARCEVVIKSLRKKDMTEALEEYRQKVEEGYFDENEHE